MLQKTLTFYLFFSTRLFKNTRTLVTYRLHVCIFFSFQKGLGDYSFLPFMVFLGCFFMFTLKYVPETKNRTIDDISMIWQPKSKRHTTNGAAPHMGEEFNFSKEIYEQIVDTSNENK